MSEPARSSQILFIADLHLSPDEPATLTNAIDFIEQARGVGTLWILGDLFDYWVGDDQLTAALEPFCLALAQLGRSGCSVHLMHGNRDFLLGKAFAAASGATLHREDSVLLELGDTPALLMHGDTLCTDDVDYQRLRERLRSSQWQRDFLARPVSERLALAASMREDSHRASAAKDLQITDVNPDAVRQAIRDAGCRVLIHGHTHRPAEHTFYVDGNACKRLVVGDWHPDGAQVARWDGHRLALETFRAP